MIGKEKLSGLLRARVSLSLAGLCLVVGSAGSVMAQSTVATGVGTPFELAFWQSIDSSSDPSLYEAYLAHFPNGTFSDIARAKIFSLRGHSAAPVPAAPALTVPVAPAGAPIGQPSATPVAPAPVEVHMMQPANPVVQPAVAMVTPAAVTPVAAPAVVTLPVAAAPAAGPVAAAPAAGTLGQLLAALAVSQSNEAGAQGGAAQPATLQPAALVSNAAPVASTPAPLAPAVAAPAGFAPIAVRPTAVSFAMPAPPTLTPVPPVAFPPSFCSAEQRNAFHDQVYAPSVSVAKRNNEATAGYLRQLQALYDQYQLSRDPDTMNAIVVAARNYEQVAQTTFSMQGQLVRQFPALMAVPVVPCAQPGQPTTAVLVK